MVHDMVATCFIVSIYASYVPNVALSMVLCYTLRLFTLFMSITVSFRFNDKYNTYYISTGVVYNIMYILTVSYCILRWLM